MSISSPIQATIVLPTTTNRGLLLPLCVRSIQQQTLQAFELFIIGDGLDESTRAVIANLMQQDNRIQFFDHPGWPTEQRYEELVRWDALLQTPAALQPAMDEAFLNAHFERNWYRESWILLRGKRIFDLLSWLKIKLRHWLRLPVDPKAEESWQPVSIKSDY